MSATPFLIDEQTHKFRFREENELVVQAGGRRRTISISIARSDTRLTPT